MNFQLNPKILPLIYAIGIALAIGVVALIFKIDEVVNVLLYEYGLRFDYEWATPYWTFLRLALGLLGCIAAANVFSTVAYIIQSRKAPVHPEPTITRQEPTIQREPTITPPTPTLKPQRQEIKKEKAHKEAEDGVEVMALPMVCSKCGKVFTQPLCMFDFKSGKPRLVNVCPYCNAILAVSGNSRSK